LINDFAGDDKEIQRSKRYQNQNQTRNGEEIELNNPFDEPRG